MYSHKSRKYKHTRKVNIRNIKNTHKKQSKQSKVNFKKYESKLKELKRVKDNAIKEGNLEVIMYSNKIIFILLLNLIVSNVDKNIKLANKYSKITGIKINKKKIKEFKKNMPQLKNTISNIYKSYNHPPLASIAPGWVWS